MTMLTATDFAAYAIGASSLIGSIGLVAATMVKASRLDSVNRHLISIVTGVWAVVDAVERVDRMNIHVNAAGACGVAGTPTDHDTDSDVPDLDVSAAPSVRRDLFVGG